MSMITYKGYHGIFEYDAEGDIFHGEVVNLSDVITFQGRSIDELKEALAELKSEYGCERITIQSGGTLNSLFLHEKLFDYIDIVIAPVLIGGKDTPTLIDGKSLLSESELSKIGVLKLQECMVLKKSYLRLRYKVIH